MLAIILIIVTILLISLVIYYLTREKKITPSAAADMAPSRLESLFNDTTTDLSMIGGFLVNNFGQEWFRKMLSAGDVNLQDTSVCASINQKTCTAYSYMRRDLTPTFFMFPGINLYVPCGIILDPKKVWPLITLMSIVDADTNNRNNCINESGSPMMIYNPSGTTDYDNCARANIISQFGPSSDLLNSAIYVPTREVFDASETECSDQNCKYIHSGGSISQWTMNSSKKCINGNFYDCPTFEEVSFQDVPDEIKSKVGPEVSRFFIQHTSCKTCKKPYLCKFADYKEDDKYETVFEDDVIANYIGADGRGFADLYNLNSSEIDMNQIAVDQCRFEKKDWNLWIRVMRDWYKLLVDKLQDPANNYIFANPNRPAYIENEINLYINPAAETKEAQDQNKIFQDAIIGFYYTDSSCEEQLQALDGVKSESGGETFTNAVDRCDKFWSYDDSTMTTQKRRDWEEAKRNESRDLVRQVADMFNKKHGLNVPVYKSRAESNSFPNINSIKKALRGETAFDFLVLDA